MLTSSIPKTSSETSSAGTLERAIIAIDATTSPIALDLETTGTDPHRDEIRLIQVLVDGKIFVIDAFRRNVAPLARAIADADVPIIAHNAAFEYGFLMRKFDVALDNLIDTYLLARIAACGDMSVDCSLGAVCERELGVKLDKEMQTSDWSVAKLDRRQLRYAAMDVKILPDLYVRLLEAIEDTGQERVAELEHGALPAVARMRLKGLPLDRKAWERHAEEKAKELESMRREMLDAEWLPERDPVPQMWQLQGEDCLRMLRAGGVDASGTTAKDLKDYTDAPIVEALLDYRKRKGEGRDATRARVYALAPKKPPAPATPWNFGSPAQVADISEKILGFYPRSTDETTLLLYVGRHPFFEAILKYRKLAKQVSTYGAEWFKDAYDSEAKRLYPGWRQIGTSTGRFSCSAPNVQNLPRSGPYRSFFGAPEGRTFVDADYSQIEVRVYAKIVGETALLNLFDNDEVDVYRATAANMLGVEESEISGEERQKAKAIMLGLLYGLSHVGLPAYAFKGYGVVIQPEEAEDLIERFFDLYPNIAIDHESANAALREFGSVDRETLTGRRRDYITNRNEAINMPIQGTAADGLKLAMAKLYSQLNGFENAFIVGAFHDELLVECDEGDAKEVRRATEDAMLEAMNELLNIAEPKVRIQVDGGISDTWAKD